MRRSLALVAVGLIAPLGAAAASADRATLAARSADPWVGGTAVVTPLEALAGRIATRIAGHPVSVHCESAPSFREANGVPDVAGLVNTLTVPATGRYAKTATVIELTSTVCGSLQLFAQTATKPTRCAPAGSTASRPCFTGVPVASDAAPAVCWTGLSTCYGAVGSMTGDYWQLYNAYAAAIQTLAHEAVHTEQAQKGQLVPKGNLVEQQADCWGMQWMPWVATQLGDAADDAQTLASYYWLVAYPLKKTSHPAYWSAACVPGGQLDIRAGRAGAWP